MFRRTGTLSILVLTAYLFCGFTAPTQCKSSGSIGPGDGEIIGVGIAVGAVVATAIAVPVIISHNHHTLKGCVVSAENGLQVQQEGDKPKTFTLVGDAPGVKVGDLVKLHGLKKKAPQGSAAEPTFVVEKVKDYGACKPPAATPAP